jgi:hypothetical protein
MKDQTVQEKQLATKPAADLVTVNNFALGALEAVEGVQSLDASDLQIPRLVLVQPTHRNTDIPGASDNHGKLYNDVTGEFKAIVTAVVMSLGKGRAAFPREFSHESEPLCASDDALAPRSDYIGILVQDAKTGAQHTITESCEGCPLKEFTENKDGTSTAPICSKSYVYAMVDSDNGIPFIMRAQRTGTSSAKRLNTIAMTQGRKRVIYITSQRVESDSGSYYVPVFTTMDDTAKDLLEHVAKMSLQFGNIAKRATINDKIAVTKATPQGDDEDMPF